MFGTAFAFFIRESRSRMGAGGGKCPGGQNSGPTGGCLAAGITGCFVCPVCGKSQL